MSNIKKIVCLANSIKLQGRCVAGREIVDAEYGKWVRPVSERDKREISDDERTYANGDKADVLDIIEITTKKAVPKDHHVEDHLIDANFKWKKIGKVDWTTLEALVEPLNDGLWLYGEDTHHGTNDKIKSGDVSKLTSSITLIKPSNLEVEVGKESQYKKPSKKVVRAKFSAGGANYSFVVTDPYYRQLDHGTYPLEEVIICVSVAEKLPNGDVSKLVAAIFTPDMKF